MLKDEKVVKSELDSQLNSYMSNTLDFIYPLKDEKVIKTELDKQLNKYMSSS